MDQVGGQLAPTFLFVDPCGVSGTSFETIKAVMGCKSSEAFIFFNIDGVRRIAGLSKVSDVLVELLGSRARAEHLFAALQVEANVRQREELILLSYQRALRDDMGVKYTVPFRIESEAKEKTSHYLIHACNHHLGFKIMKEIMWKQGRSEEGEHDLQLTQASRTNYIPLFDLRGDAIKKTIVQALERGPLRVRVFYEDWVCRPEDMLCEGAYRKALLELEQEGNIEVLDKDGRSPKPSAERPRRNGKPTLGKEHYVRLSSTAK
jgi:hypothetical protein